MEPARPTSYQAEPTSSPEPAPASHVQRKNRSVSWPRRALAVLFVAAVLAIVAASLRPRAEPPTPVQMTNARRSAITRKVTAAGKLQAATTVKVSSNVSGDLVELPVKEGDRVAKGQLLARIEGRRYLAQVRQQEALRASASAELAAERAILERTKGELGRVERLARGGNASQAEVDRALADARTEQAKADAAQERIAQAEAALADARHLLSFATIYAPIDGIVVTRAKQVGERVRGSDFNEDPIVTIATLSAMEAKVEVGEHEVVFLHEGDRAEVEIDAFPDRKFPAQVIEVAKNANVKNPGTEAEVTTFPVRLALSGPSFGALPGMSCQASISTETHESAVVVPIQAVTVRTEKDLAEPRAGDAPPREAEPSPSVSDGTPKPRREPLRKVVFVVEGTVARARPVETGLADESSIEIVSGLSEGERIVEGPYKALSRELRPGKPVVPVTEDNRGRKSRGP
jgi:HlyD family secretion protein